MGRLRFWKTIDRVGGRGEHFADNKMTIQSDKNIANTYKTVRKWTVSKLKQLESTTKQIELCEFE